MRGEWKNAERERLEEENRKIKEFAALQAVREEERQEAKKEQEEFRARVQSEVSIFCVSKICTKLTCLC